MGKSHSDINLAVCRMLIVRRCFRVLNKCSCSLVCNLTWCEKGEDLVSSDSYLKVKFMISWRGGIMCM